MTDLSGVFLFPVANSVIQVLTEDLRNVCGAAGVPGEHTWSELRPQTLGSDAPTVIHGS